MKRNHVKRDERLTFWRNFVAEFGSILLIIFINSYGLIAVYNHAITVNNDKYKISVVVFIYLIIGCLVSAFLVYITRIRSYSRNVQKICRAAQKVAGGDYSVRLDVYKDKVAKNEIDILKEDFNKMVDELTSVNRLRDDFVADVSHEIKTPLSTIQGYADLLRTPGLSEEKRTEYINLISEAIHKLTALVRNILILNKIENQEIVQKEKFSLDEQIRTCFLSFEEKTEEKNITLKADLEEVNIKSDKSLLEIVWNNLFSNAVKFTDYGGEISVSLKKEHGRVYVTVKDSGCGMSEETQKHIFDKFYQGDTSRSGEGNGLGLSLVMKVVNKLDGEISVESKQGEGSAFTVVL